MAKWCGIASLIGAAIGPCTCYITYLIAFPAGIGALWTGWKAHTGADSGAAGAAMRADAITGLVTGGVGLLLSTLVLGVLCLYIVFVVVFGMIGALGGL